jgi:hypothetical protein
MPPGIAEYLWILGIYLHMYLGRYLLFNIKPLHPYRASLAAVRGNGSKVDSGAQATGLPTRYIPRSKKALHV